MDNAEILSVLCQVLVFIEMELQTDLEYLYITDERENNTQEWILMSAFNSQYKLSYNSLSELSTSVTSHQGYLVGFIIQF